MSRLSTLGKLVVSIIVIGGLALGVWFLSNKKTPVETPVSIVNTQQPAPETPRDTTGGIAARDNSTASLDADLSTIDATMTIVDQNSAEADKSLNDKPVTQTE